MSFRRDLPSLLIAFGCLSALCLAGPVGCGVLAKAGKGLLPSFGSGKEKDTPTFPAGGVQVPLGEITYVDEASRFVLVRTGRTIQMRAGSPLEARRGFELVAELTYSPERRQGFLVADIRRGGPMVGDLVMVHSSEISNEEAVRRRAEERARANEEALKRANLERGRKRLRKKH